MLHGLYVCRHIDICVVVKVTCTDAAEVCVKRLQTMENCGNLTTSALGRRKAFRVKHAGLNALTRKNPDNIKVSQCKKVKLPVGNIQK